MTAIILAAGFSKRFGIQKLSQPINNRPMIQHVIDVVTRIRFEKCILVYQHEDVRRIADEHLIKCVFNPNAVDGLSSSVKCGVASAEKTDGYVFFMGDQPFIDEQTIKLHVYTFYKNTLNEFHENDTHRSDTHKNIGSIVALQREK